MFNPKMLWIKVGGHSQQQLLQRSRRMRYCSLRSFLVYAVVGGKSARGIVDLEELSVVPVGCCDEPGRTLFAGEKSLPCPCS